jgi:hypothetical protein
MASSIPGARAPVPASAPESSHFLSFDEAVKSFQDTGFLFQTIPKIGELLSPEAKTTDGFDRVFKDIVFGYPVRYAS